MALGAVRKKNMVNEIKSVWLKTMAQGPEAPKRGSGPPPGHLFLPAESSFWTADGSIRISWSGEIFISWTCEKKRQKIGPIFDDFIKNDRKKIEFSKKFSGKNRQKGPRRAGYFKKMTPGGVKMGPE